MAFRDILHNLPEVKSPEEKKVSFNIKLKWTIVILVAFFVLANIKLFGITEGELARFEYLEIILGTDFGSIITLGIGPIVMSSIILQLLTGAKILDIDTHSAEGKKYFQSLQKMLTFAFVIFEAIVYVLMGGIQAMPGMTFLVVFQLCLGGFLIVFMDEVVQKWGFGSGVSLFIAAGVGWRLFTALFQFIGTQGTFEPVGQVLALIFSLKNSDPTGAVGALVAILITAGVFLLVVWAQSLKVEIPLSFDRVRGYGVRWPLQFFYASVIPVILVSALAANAQLAGGLIENAAMPCLDDDIETLCGGSAKFASYFTFFGRFSAQGTPESGLSYWIFSPPLLDSIIRGYFVFSYLLQSIGHVLFYVTFSVIFAFFWVNTSGMDAASQAKNIMSSGLNMPGFRRDERVLEAILKRYITPLTVMGGAAIGLLASAANLLGALVGGTAILLAVMILYQFYQNIAQQHAVDMHPSLKGLFG
jgi:preprotein translocase subunit SecY